MTKPNVFLLPILLIASLFYLSHTLTLFGIPIDEVYIRGTLRCSLNGNPSAPPVSNATVYLVCGGANSTIAQAVTNPYGVFVIVLNTVETLLINPSECSIKANLPTGTCEIIPPDGTLSASVNLVNITIRGLLFIANYAAGAFRGEARKVLLWGPPINYSVTCMCVSVCK
ncbi:Pollen Ole e 1 allergen and extensin family protein [Raphanus sativus]|nr:Pollen Ole e 1 allergen and extensin family protein [Raphanus sativus]